jgi:hypothetical protein
VTVTVRFDESAGVVEMLLAGANSGEELDAAMVQAGMLGAEMLANRYLVDCREAAGGGSAFDVLAVAEFLAAIPPGVIEREAVLLPRDVTAAQDMRFFETAARNRGLNVRVFDDRDQAVAWLTE